MAVYYIQVIHDNFHFGIFKQEPSISSLSASFLSTPPRHSGVILSIIQESFFFLSLAVIQYYSTKEHTTLLRRGSLFILAYA